MIIINMVIGYNWNLVLSGFAICSDMMVNVIMNESVGLFRRGKHLLKINLYTEEVLN